MRNKTFNEENGRHNMPYKNSNTYNYTRPDVDNKGADASKTIFRENVQHIKKTPTVCQLYRE